MKKQVMLIAHKIRSFFSSFSDALKMAWRIYKMKSGIKTHITFVKETAEVREADVIAIGSLSTLEKGYLRFVEVVNEVSQWRSFKLNRVIF